MATIFLVDPETGTPLAIMDGRLITEMRDRSRVSSGDEAADSPMQNSRHSRQRRASAQSCGSAADVFGNFEEIRVWSPTTRTARTIRNRSRRAAQMSAEEAVRGADVIVTVTSSKTPVLEGAWLKPAVT
jgi:thiomorpholine-carboxylate dehydrogenase